MIGDHYCRLAGSVKGIASRTKCSQSLVGPQTCPLFMTRHVKGQCGCSRGGAGAHQPHILRHHMHQHWSTAQPNIQNPCRRGLHCSDGIDLLRHHKMHTMFTICILYANIQKAVQSRAKMQLQPKLLCLLSSRSHTPAGKTGNAWESLWDFGSTFSKQIEERNLKCQHSYYQRNLDRPTVIQHQTPLFSNDYLH